MNRLGVSAETLIKYGAVSEETAKEMAEGLIKGDVTVSVSTTGIAGPTGGTVEKPVGTVCFGFCLNGKTFTERQIFSGTREEIRKKSTDFAFYKLYLLLSKEFSKLDDNDVLKLSDIENKRFDAVQAADVRHGRSVAPGDAAQRVARTDLVVFHGRFLGGFLLVLLLVGDLVFEILSGVGVDAEERLLQEEGLAAQRSVLEVDQAFGVERLSVVAGLEVEMRSRRPARRPAQTDDLPRLDPLVGFHQTFRQVAVVGLQPVVVADNDLFAVATRSSK